MKNFLSYFKKKKSIDPAVVVRIIEMAKMATDSNLADIVTIVWPGGWDDLALKIMRRVLPEVIEYFGIISDLRGCKNYSNTNERSACYLRTIIGLKDKVARGNHLRKLASRIVAEGLNISEERAGLMVDAEYQKLSIQLTKTNK